MILIDAETNGKNGDTSFRAAENNGNTRREQRGRVQRRIQALTSERDKSNEAMVAFPPPSPRKISRPIATHQHRTRFWRHCRSMKASRCRDRRQVTAPRGAANVTFAAATPATRR
jgi:hypothetical protein